VTTAFLSKKGLNAGYEFLAGLTSWGEVWVLEDLNWSVQSIYLATGSPFVFL